MGKATKSLISTAATLSADDIASLPDGDLKSKLLALQTVVAEAEAEVAATNPFAPTESAVRAAIAKGQEAKLFDKLAYAAVASLTAKRPLFCVGLDYSQGQDMPVYTVSAPALAGVVADAFRGKLNGDLRSFSATIGPEPDMVTVEPESARANRERPDGFIWAGEPVAIVYPLVVKEPKTTSGNPKSHWRGGRCFGQYAPDAKVQVTLTPIAKRQPDMSAGSFAPVVDGLFGISILKLTANGDIAKVVSQVNGKEVAISQEPFVPDAKPIAALRALGWSNVNAKDVILKSGLTLTAKSQGDDDDSQEASPEATAEATEGSPTESARVAATSGRDGAKGQGQQPASQPAKSQPASVK